jgi:putative tricarboxylic transport membrane protein
MEGLRMLGEALLGFMRWDILLSVAWSTGLGIIIGMLPGLTATMGVALLTTLTFKMAANNAIITLVCMYIGAIYGGSRSAILLNIPGTPANAATCVDGYPLAKQGLAGRAIGIATTGSFLGSVIGMIVMAGFTPWLGAQALRFKSFEMFWFAIFGIIICGNLTAPKDPIKGWIAGFIGLLVSMIGMEGRWSYPRFSFGSVEISGGIQLIPAMVGAFGFAEIIAVMRHPVMETVNTKIDRIWPKLKDITMYWKTIIRSGIVGTIIGIIPGVGEDTAAWVSYDLAKRSSKEKEKFGKGSIEGLMASETGNNACVPGAIIPVLTLAVPGSAPAAVLLGAMLIHGVHPGPMIMQENPTFVSEVVAMVLLATVAMFVLGMSLVRPLVKVLQVPRSKLMPIVFILCMVGSFAIQQRFFDIGVMIIFGILGFFMRELDYPMAPMVLGIVLGDILDKNLRRALVISGGNPVRFFDTPVSLILIGLTVLVVVARTRWFAAGWAAGRAAIVGLFRKKSS